VLRRAIFWSDQIFARSSRGSCFAWLSGQSGFDGDLWFCQALGLLQISFEKDCLVLKNIAGLLGIEHGIAHGIEAPLEKIMVKPPNKPVFALNMGLSHPQRVLDL
jgi:hypothetical protein